jgi:hypothetical protein
MSQRHDYSGSHLRDAYRIANEGPKTMEGKPIKRAPKLQPWEVLKRFGIDQAEVAACVKMAAPKLDIWARLRIAGIRNKRAEAIDRKLRGHSIN